MYQPFPGQHSRHSIITEPPARWRPRQLDSMETRTPPPLASYPVSARRTCSKVTRSRRPPQAVDGFIGNLSYANRFKKSTSDAWPIMTSLQQWKLSALPRFKPSAIGPHPTANSYRGTMNMAR